MPGEDTVVRVGQVYASSDKRDRLANHNQRRRVADVDSRYAYFEPAYSWRKSLSRVLLDGRGGIQGHRLIEEAPNP